MPGLVLLLTSAAAAALLTGNEARGPDALQSRALSADSGHADVAEAVAAGYARAHAFASTELDSLLPAEGGRTSIPPGYMEAVVCPSAGLFFIHVYKAAGVTVTAVMDRECGNATGAAGAVCMMHEYGACGEAANAECSCGETMFVRQPRTLFAPGEPAAVKAARSPPSNGLFFTLVRDPLDKLISAMSELDMRGELGVSLNATDLLDSVLRRIRAEGFFNAHLWPSSLFLVDPIRNSTSERLAKLPMDFIGTAEQSGPALAWLRWRLRRGSVRSSPTDWLVSTDGSGSEESEHHNVQVGGLHTDLSGRIHPTDAHLREVCRLYRVDYVALQMPHPSACDDMFG